MQSFTGPVEGSGAGSEPLRSALKSEDEGERVAQVAKAVQIAEPERENPEEAAPRKQYTAGLAKRLSGRPPILGHNSSRPSFMSQSSILESQTGHSHTTSPQPDSQGPASSFLPLPLPNMNPSQHHHRPHISHISERLVSQVAEWLQSEKVKRENRATRKHYPTRRKSKSPVTGNATEAANTADKISGGRQRSYSIDSQSSDTSLDRLQRILDDSMAALGLKNVPQYSTRLFKRSSQQRKRPAMPRAASSDTDYHDGDSIVPGCNEVLDNTKTIIYAGAGRGEDATAKRIRKKKEERAWAVFKNDVIRLTHTLKIKGWRRVPLDAGDSIRVDRLSGALTNAVYVVSPPETLPLTDAGPAKKPPANLLLRIYGPQVENIIDRDNELSVLRRLARKKIGPRLLGTFDNGRFEQFFNAITLTPEHLREPDTSKLIAKRMRELHDGIELLEEEKDSGPAVWKNWDHWLDNTARVTTFLDRKQLAYDDGLARGSGSRAIGNQRGFVCGTDWDTFKNAVDRCREYVKRMYGTPEKLREQLVFAHNDTQYGNILRLKPDDKRSPLIMPQNEHKQLIVIDFEYAAANVRGLEFANHFTEWTYNYHDPERPYDCDISKYPTPEEQRRFIKAYVIHRPQFPHAGSTPNLLPVGDTPTDMTPLSLSAAQGGAAISSASSIADFILDARMPSGGYKEDEKRREEQVEREITDLMEETRLWRMINSAQWVAWGIMQAKVPGLETDNINDLNEKKDCDDPNGTQAGAETPPEDDEQGEDEFDYLKYAHQRALFFWGDCVNMGLVDREELPQELRERIKVLGY